MVDRISAAGFIGRERELAELEASLADAREARPRLAFVAGESGVGKSRLLGEFERRAQMLGARTVGGECIELGDDELPFAPLVGAVRPLARADDPAFDELPEFARGELARLAPELGPAARERTEDREG
jgi:predicted ATPase